MKIFLQILLIGFYINSYSQSIPVAISDILKSDFPEDNKQELQQELENAFQKVKEQSAINLNSAVTLYIIRGVDIQTREAYGRIWNDKILIHYTDSKKRKKNKIIGSNVEISQDNVTENFEPIIKWIEKGNYKKVEKYAEKNKVLSGVNWLIIRIQRSEKEFKIDYKNISDFDNLE